MKFISMSMVLAFVSILHFSCSSPANALMSTLGGNPQLSGISSLLKGAGGLGNLVGKGPFTLLAPSNNALSSLGAGALENLEEYRIVDQARLLIVCSGKKPFWH